MTVEVERKLLKWGNGYGIRLTAAEVHQLGLHAGAAVHAAVEPAKHVQNDLSNLPLFNFGGQPYDIDELLDEDADETLRRWQKK